MAEARSLGLSLTEVSEHARYSREWVRKATARVNDEQDSPPGTDDESDHASE